MAMAKLLVSSLLACYALREDALHRSFYSLTASHAHRARSVPGPVAVALRKANGEEKRKLRKVEKHLEELAKKEKLAEEVAQIPYI